MLASRALAPKPQAPPAPLFRTLKGGLGTTGGRRRRRHPRQSRRCARRAPKRSNARPTGFRVRVDGEWLEADRLVVACEAHSGASLLAAGRCARIRTAGQGGLQFVDDRGRRVRRGGLRQPAVGFGFLVPKKERRRLVACTWVGTKFSYRVPEGKIVARCFLGGMEDAGVLGESDEAVIAAVTQELREIAGVTAPPRFTRIARWPRSMAQYTVGHPARLAELKRASRHPGPLRRGQRLPGNRHPRLHSYGQSSGREDP